MPHPDRGRRGMVSGMSMIEVMIAISILVIGMGGFSILFLRSWLTNGFILESGIASSAASRVVRETVAELRKVRQADDGDYPVESGDDFDFTAYIDIDGDGATERIHYYLENRQFKRGITEPTATQPVTYPVGDQTVTVLTSDVANEPDEPVFFYYNENYPGDTTGNPMPTPVVIADVRIVGVRLFINIDPNRDPEHTVIESSAELRNINAYVP